MKLLTVAASDDQHAGQIRLDLDDPVIRSMTVAHAGEVLWPPPPVAVAAAPVAQSGQPGAGNQVAAPLENSAEVAARKRRRSLMGLGLAVVLFALVGSLSPVALLGHWLVLLLAVVVGFYVISNVSHALHTP